ncbi:MAG: CLI_3235 family bacteriocin precursor [Clostridia bacterium]|nr:CLI_3235 family bacteriocin precursor [Clostridia bacterium]
MRKLVKKSSAIRETLQANCGRCSCDSCSWYQTSSWGGVALSSAINFYGGK